MSESRDDSQAWIEASRQGVTDAGSHDDRLLAFIRDVDARYQGNASAPEDAQIPLEIFEELIDGAQRVLTASTSEAVYAALQALPPDTFARSGLVQAGRNRRLAVLDQALAAAPDDAEAYCARGQLRYDDRDDEGAAADFATALKLDARHQEARRGAIRVALRDDRDRDALAELDELLRLAPDDIFGLVERARLRTRYHHAPEALVDLERLAAAAPPGEALLYAARQLASLGRSAAAATAAARMSPDIEAMVVLGKALLDLGESARAIATLEQALAQPHLDERLQRLANAKATALALLGEAHQRDGEPARALERTLEAMAIAGPTYELRRMLAMIAWRTRRDVDHSPASDQPGGLALARRWIEPTMEAEFVDGRPTVIRVHELVLVPYLERLPWIDTVVHLMVAPGARDERDAFHALFRLQLPQLRHLEIHAEHFGWTCVRHLVAAPFFAALEGLTLVNCDLDAPALELLFERLPRGLRALRVVGADARPSLPRATSVAAALRAMDFRALEALSLRDCALVAGDVDALLEANLPALIALDLTGNSLQELHADRFLASPLVQRLRHVRLRDTAAPSALLAALAGRGTETA